MVISRFPGIWKFQENDNSKILSEKPNSVTNTVREKYLTYCNLSKTAISTGFPDFLEPGIWKSGNLEILEVPQNANKYSMIDPLIGSFRILAKKVGCGTFSILLLNIYINPDAEKRQLPLLGTFSKENFFFDDGLHLKSEGNEIIADEIFKSIMKNIDL